MTTRLTDEALAELERQNERLPPAPWRSRRNRHPETTGEDWGDVSDANDRRVFVWTDKPSGLPTQEAAGWLVAARNALASLLAEVRASRSLSPPGNAARIECPRCLHEWCPCCGATEGEPCTHAAAPPSSARAPDLSTHHQPKETIMDSRGHVHMYEDTAPTAAPSAERFRHTGFVTREPMPEKCDPRRVLAALDKIAEGWPGNEPVPESAAALAPLTPFERGYVLGVLAEYRSWLANR